MEFTRRQSMVLGLAGMAVTVMPFAARAQEATQQANPPAAPDDGMKPGGDTYKTDNGEIGIIPIAHASFVMTVPGMVIYADPVGGADAFSAYPAADLILVTHEHQDHFSPETLSALVGEETKLVVNPAVMEKLPADLKARATAIANGEDTTVGDVAIEAVPAYNTTEERKKYHPQGRDNGYLLTVDGKRVYIAGDTEDIPEMRALKDIFIAFVPMNLPYTMDVNQAASAVAEFKPQYVYPYHYRDSDPQAFAKAVADASGDVEVVMGPWYG